MYFWFFGPDCQSCFFAGAPGPKGFPGEAGAPGEKGNF